MTKEHHEWEQGLREAEGRDRESLGTENDLICDPFLGSGTSAVAAKRLNRRFVGCDEDLDAVNTTLARLAQELEPNESNGATGQDETTPASDLAL